MMGRLWKCVVRSIQMVFAIFVLIATATTSQAGFITFESAGADGKHESRRIARPFRGSMRAI